MIGSALLRDAAGGNACIADEVRESDSVERVTEQGEARECAEARLDFGDSIEMADFVLGKAGRPAADHGENRGRGWSGYRRGDRRGVIEGAGEFETGDGGDFVVVAAGKAVGCSASEEGSNEAAVGRDAVGKLLVGESAGEEKAGGRIERPFRMRENGGNEKAETGRERNAGCLGVAEGDEDGRAGFGGEEVSRGAVQRGDELTGGAERSSEQDRVKGLGGEVTAVAGENGPGRGVAAMQFGAGRLERTHDGIEAKPVGRNCCDEAIDEGTEAAAERGEEGR
jgi:hypothetical protein